MTQYLPTVNAALNALATVLLLVGYVQIRRRRQRVHRNIMLAAFGVSILFLISYLIYHGIIGSKRFEHAGFIRPVYYTILLTHVTLAAAVPVLAGTTIYLGLRDRRAGHRRLARWTFPIWLYVSVTGVVIYAMLYHLPPAGTPATAEAPSVAPILAPQVAAPERREVHFSGQVQGVGFRATTREIAGGFRVRGFVENLPDGRVRLIVEGEPGELDAFLAAVVRRMKSNIKDVQTRVQPATGEFTEFEIRQSP